VRLLILYDWENCSVEDVYRLWVLQNTEILPGNYVAFAYSGKTDKVYRTRKDVFSLIQRVEDDVHPVSLEVYFGVVDYSDPEKKWEVYFDCSVVSRAHKTCVVAYNYSNFSEKKIVEFIKNFTSRSKVEYAFSYIYNGQGDPRYYASGTSSGTTSEEIASANARWKSQRMSVDGAPPERKHVCGFFRDIYAINVINENHYLNIKKIFSEDDFSLFDISNIGGKNYLWFVKDEDRMEIYVKLQAAGLII